MLNMNCPSPHFKLLEPAKPVFELHKSIPPGISKQLEAAVKDFIKTSHMPQGVDWNGFYYQTLKAIANSAIFGQGGDLWLGISHGELWTYILGHIGQDIDDRLSYTVTQAWVRQDQRGKPWVKQAWEKVRERARDAFCGHFIVISSRGHDEAYCRFLGKGFHFYASILKQEL